MKVNMFRKIKKKLYYPIKWVIIKWNNRRKKEVRTKKEIDDMLTVLTEEWMLSLRKSEVDLALEKQNKIDILNWVLYES
jgi:CRISPR/Cas system-associated exonuclease Cas4 (RecB family)